MGTRKCRPTATARLIRKWKGDPGANVRKLLLELRELWGPPERPEERSAETRPAADTKVTE
jgi:hypothetical protein